MHDETTSDILKTSTTGIQETVDSTTARYKLGSSLLDTITHPSNGNSDSVKATTDSNPSVATREAFDGTDDVTPGSKREETTTWKGIVSNSKRNSITKMSASIPPSSTQSTDEELQIQVFSQETDIEKHSSVISISRDIDAFEIGDSMFDGFHPTSSSNERSQHSTDQFNDT